ncbi:hypothetical protein N865_13410 [Intrasporangium oryzae NRRL B-24470]|uniref:SAF domain-containing protein n=1 Tax=Intrasporangium oryzae NRRL B-24470 TaxID=1386089 RepID=W9G682_9MICO|nr:SAF domain-containing protein [Intrasporangium oryzae]EWT00827.1 hypothetical protein N865_13410 [Intrasporangium oryzae NRRL B-24470]
MTELARPAAKRLQRPSWRDSRLVVGILLVLLSATLGAKAVASADDRTPVYVAADDLVAGDRVTASSFTRVDVRLGEGVVAYLPADAPAPEGSYLLRDVRAGELVPRSAVGAPDAVRVQRVTVRSDTGSTAGLVRGSRVDVYVTPKTGSGLDDADPVTRKLLAGAAVAAVQTRGGSLGGTATTSVQVYVPAGKVQALVEAVDAEAKVTLVPVPGTATDGAS